MNVGRGLVRAWIVVSIIWIVVAGPTLYFIMAGDIEHGNFQPTVVVRKEAGEIDKIDWNRPFYELAISPTAAKLQMEFAPVEWLYVPDWKKGQSHNIVTLPDGSTLFVPKGYNQADKDYITHQFWEQRWRRLMGAFTFAAGFALVPCALLFILGYATWWIGRGFKTA